MIRKKAEGSTVVAITPDQRFLEPEFEFLRHVAPAATRRAEPGAGDWRQKSAATATRAARSRCMASISFAEAATVGAATLTLLKAAIWPIFLCWLLKPLRAHIPEIIKDLIAIAKTRDVSAKVAGAELSITERFGVPAGVAADISVSKTLTLATEALPAVEPEKDVSERELRNLRRFPAKPLLPEKDRV